MERWHIEYHSITAYYDMGYVYATTKEEAERKARAKATAFSTGEKTLIKATKSNK